MASMQTYTEAIRVRVSTKIKQRIEKAATRKAMSPSAFIRWCVEEMLNELDWAKKKHPKEGF